MTDRKTEGKIFNQDVIIDNKELDQAIEHFRQSQTQINRELFVQKLLLSQVLVPINIQNVTVKDNKEVIIPKASDVNLITLQNESGDTYCPVFTNSEELNKYNQEKSGVLKQNFVKLAKSIVPSIKENDGIVINPFGVSLTLNKAILESMINTANNANVARNYTIEEGTKVLIGDPKVYPQKIVDIMKDVLKNHKCVNRAWIRLMQRPDNGLSYLIIVDSQDDDLNHLFTDMATLCKPYVDNIPQDFIRYKKDSSFANSAIKNAKPFYTKHKKFLFF